MKKTAKEKSEKKEPEAYESYPVRTLILYNVIFIINYAAGIYILSQLWIWLGLLFILYILFLEWIVYREGCSCCYYYGKRCFSGRGKLAPKFVKRDDPKKFCEKEVTAKNLMPQILALVFPVAGGAILLYLSFSWLIVGLMLIPVLIWFFGNPLIYGNIACPHCKQGRICCPANDFFSGKSRKKKKGRSE
ncbi:MAG: hypothetical protein JSV63_03240 [Candidatus Aenigmatarchaeota archaeon]|nr:MAG: hypothetical protein JSV63_03240 [Candidatus Aenigmarchaeota archaeon]